MAIHSYLKWSTWGSLCKGLCETNGSKKLTLLWHDASTVQLHLLCLECQWMLKSRKRFLRLNRFNSYRLTRSLCRGSPVGHGLCSSYAAAKLQACICFRMISSSHVNAEIRFLLDEVINSQNTFLVLNAVTHSALNENIFMLHAAWIIGYTRSGMRRDVLPSEVWKCNWFTLTWGADIVFKEWSGSLFLCCACTIYLNISSFVSFI